MTAGMEVLDVATGTGATALAAASRGATVSGLDLTRAMLEGAGRLAGGHSPGARPSWVQGDALAQPFATASFDRVLSCFGVMVVADHGRAAEELVRVCRPGGSIGLCNWTPDSVAGIFGRTVSSFLGRAPDQPSWGVEDDLRRFLDRHDLSITCERGSGVIELGSPGDYVELLTELSGPAVVQRRMLTAQGAWGEFCQEVCARLEACNQTPGVGWRGPQQYLLTVAERGVHT